MPATAVRTGMNSCGLPKRTPAIEGRELRIVNCVPGRLTIHSKRAFLGRSFNCDSLSLPGEPSMTTPLLVLTLALFGAADPPDAKEKPKHSPYAPSLPY